MREGAGMRIEQLATFRCVADERSYTRAAERLFVTQSAVYQQVRQLEQEVGSKLCYVLGKEVLLTAAGRAVYDFAAAVQERHDELRRLLKHLGGADEQVIRIASASYFGLLPIAAEHVAIKHPGTVVEFHSLRPSEAIERIRGGEVDFAFFGLAYVPADLVAEPCVEQRIAVAVPADHELAMRETLDFAELQDYPLIGYIGGSAKTAVDAWLKQRAGIAVRYAALGDTSVGIKAMALSMHLPAIVAEAAIADEVRAGRMKVLNIPDFEPSYTLYAVHRGRETLSPAAIAYLAEILSLGGHTMPDAERAPAPQAALTC
jgi:LysR family transcriptional regulator, low CO2-responsive transcriptional regulator